MIKEWRGNKNKDEKNISFRNKIRIEHIKKKIKCEVEKMHRIMRSNPVLYFLF